MIIIKSRARAFVLLASVLLASCMLASLTILSCAPREDSVAVAGAAGGVPSRDRLLAPGGTLMYVNVYSTDPKVGREDVETFARFFLWPELGGLAGGVDVKHLNGPINLMRVRLDPERMRAGDIWFEDVEQAMQMSRMLTRHDWLDAVDGKTFPSRKNQNELFFFSLGVLPEQYTKIILRTSPQGKILRLEDVGQVEVAVPLFDISSNVDGHPAGTIDFKRNFDFDAAAVVEKVQKRLKKFKTKSVPPGMELEAVPFENQRMVYAVIESSRGSTRQFTSAKCYELVAMAKDLAEVASVTSLVGYQLRTQTGSPNVATCLIRLKDRSYFQRTPRQIIATLEEKCRAINAHVEFFEPPAFSAFFTFKGFSVRFLDKANSLNDERRKKMDALLNREDLASLFTFLDSDYWEYELVIDNDAAAHEGLSIANALEHLAKVVSSDGDSEQKFDALVEDLAHSSVKNDRGEMVPYRSFMQLKNKLRLSAVDR